VRLSVGLSWSKRMYPRPRVCSYHTNISLWFRSVCRRLLPLHHVLHLHLAQLARGKFLQFHYHIFLRTRMPGEGCFHRFLHTDSPCTCRTLRPVLLRFRSLATKGSAPLRGCSLSDLSRVPILLRCAKGNKTTYGND